MSRYSTLDFMSSDDDFQAVSFETMYIKDIISYHCKLDTSKVSLD